MGPLRYGTANPVSPLARFQAHADQAQQVAFLDEELLVTSGLDPWVRDWDWRNKKEVRAIGGHRKGVTTLSYDPASKMIYSGWK